MILLHSPLPYLKLSLQLILFQKNLKRFRALALLFLFLFLQSCQSNPESTEPLRMGSRHFQDGHRMDSITRYQRQLSWDYLDRGMIDSAVMHSFGLIQDIESAEVIEDEKIIDAYYHFSRILLNTKAEELASDYMLRTINLYEKAGFDTTWYYNTLIGSMASLYLKQEKFIEARVYFDKSIQIAEKVEWRSRIAGVLNNIGILKERMGQIDSAEFYFLRARDLYAKENMDDNSFVFSINNNLGGVAYKQKNYTKSYEYFKTNNDLAKSLINQNRDAYYRIVTSNVGLAKNLVALNRTTEAAHVLKLATNGLDALSFDKRARFVEEIGELKKKIALKNGDFRQYIELVNNVARFKDSLHTAEIQALSAITHRMASLQIETANLNLKTNQQELLLAKEEKKFNRWLAIGAIVLLVTIISFFIILAKKRTKQFRVERKLQLADLKNKELEKESLNLKLKNQARDLSELSGYTLLARKIVEEAKDRLKRLKNLDLEEQKRELNVLSGDLTRQLNNNKAKALIQENLHEISAEFYAALSKKSNKKLSLAEMELCALFRLKLSDSQIADIRGISNNAVQVARYRIKKKLAISKADQLSEVLLEL